jgi:hypothetical protein
MSNTVADVMITTLKAAGVRRIYGLPGDSTTRSPTRCAVTARSSGSMFATRKQPHSQPGARRP